MGAGPGAGIEKERALLDEQVAVGVSRRLGPGPATIEGLRWLARVGPTPIDAWACAMGWAVPTAKSHAARLSRERWIGRVARPQEDGSLVFATRQGVQVAGIDVPPAPAPAPIWWDHLAASAWVAAWLSVRGRDLVGPRELIADRSKAR